MKWNNYKFQLRFTYSVKKTNKLDLHIIAIIYIIGWFLTMRSKIVTVDRDRIQVKISAKYINTSTFKSVYN
jgi:uncharacterized membrane protein (Fun14 family)